MNGGKAAGGGYTIVETLIFLAVTGVLFAIAFAFIGNKQASTQFTQASRDFQSQLEDYINDVSDGFYPSTSNFTCNGGGLNGPTFSAAHTGQGSNDSCIFAGKVLQFNTGASTFNIYSLAGNRQKGSPPVDIQTLDDAKAVPIVTPVDLTASSNFLYGLNVTAMFYAKGATVNPIGAVGFFNSLGNYSGGDPLTGINSVLVVPIYPSSSSSGVDPLSNHTAFATNRLNPSNPLYPIKQANADPDTVVICTVGGNGTKAAYIIGGSGRQTTVQLKIGAYSAGGITCP